MAYRIVGLDPASFAHLHALDAAGLAALDARRVVADADRGFPCRVSLEDARTGETLILVNHADHRHAGPYSHTHAIFIRETARQAAVHTDRVPAVMDTRILALRGFAADGMMRSALLAQPGEAHDAILTLLEDPEIVHINAYNAIRGCFSARIERHDA